MQNYISEVIAIISKDANKNYKNLTIVLPSKRAGVFVKYAIKAKNSRTTFLPNIISIEEFICELSLIQPIDSISLLFEFYTIYIENTPKDKITDFDQFSAWATTLIQDFNEIDRFLVDPKYIFSYIKDINRINNWFKDNQSKTTLTQNYLAFFDYVAIYYEKFQEHLLNLKIGYQGLQYREACNNLDQYINDNANKKFTFIGFNALNKAEETIIKKLLYQNMATIHFDIDAFFIKENLAPANFISSYQKTWSHFKNNDFTTISNHFEKIKEIHVIGVPKNVSQTKEVAHIIKNELTEKELLDTTLVLANESLLTVTLNSLPENLKSVNITMGYPLKNISLASLFSLLFKLHQNKNKIGSQKSFYFKDVIGVLNHSSVAKLFHTEKETTIINIVNWILKNNYTFINETQLLSLVTADNHITAIKLIFSNWNNTGNVLNKQLELLDTLAIMKLSKLEIAYIDHFKAVFTTLQNLNTKYSYISSLDSLFQLYKQLLSTESLSFKGNAKHGFQIMGMLETRVLDFETVILTSVNEGFLPAGKSNNSFIPFDVKRELKMPTYHEKDAIFAYHFYRLIARAKKVYLLYNTETDDFGSGEQSRFITQLEVLKDKLPNLKLTKIIVSPKVETTLNLLKEIPKTKEVLEILKTQAEKGFSPSSLTNYIYNPLAFYKQKILRLSQLDELEETVAANTFGNVIHNVLEEFYKPFKGEILKLIDVLDMKKNIEKNVKIEFSKEYVNGDLSKGKNLLIFEVAKQFMVNFLNQEIKLLKSGAQLKIISLEEPLECQINIKGISHPIKLHGKADRIDELNGVLRIIDYKTGKAEPSNLSIKNWNLLLSDSSKSKAFQVLLYAYMLGKMKNIDFENTPVESGIVSFKNLKAGFMRVKKSRITNDDMMEFEVQLKNLLLEIFDIEYPFKENENLKY